MTTIDSKRTIPINSIFVLIAVLMPTLLIHAREGHLRYVSLAMPYIFLGTLWHSYRFILKKDFAIDELPEDQVRLRFERMRDIILTQIGMSAAGIGISFAFGFSLGHG